MVYKSVDLADMTMDSDNNSNGKNGCGYLSFNVGDKRKRKVKRAMALCQSIMRILRMSVLVILSWTAIMVRPICRPMLSLNMALITFWTWQQTATVKMKATVKMGHRCLF